MMFLHQADWLSPQVHHSGPLGSPLLPGEQWRARGAGRGGRHGEVRPEAVAAHGRHKEAPREVQGQQRHRVPLWALQRRARGGGSGDGQWRKSTLLTRSLKQPLLRKLSHWSQIRDGGDVRFWSLVVTDFNWFFMAVEQEKLPDSYPRIRNSTLRIGLPLILGFRCCDCSALNYITAKGYLIWVKIDLILSWFHGFYG